MDTNYYKKYEPFFGNWYITREIGSGSFGKVFEIERKEMGMTYKAALKAITIPAEEQEIRNAMFYEGMTRDEAEEYYRSVAEYFYQECILMSKLKGNTNIVGYEDHQIVKRQNEIGWDIFIRMELLTPLREYLHDKNISEKLVCELAKDVCSALILCEKNNIIHRDIKPENIFVNDNGAFKLGDFGVAKTLQATSGASTKVGTLDYSAPEVFGEKKYDLRVDIYSLGIVMYRLLNENRQPFLPLPPENPTFNQREEAKHKRMNGEKMPYPVHAEKLGDIILKACEFRPEDRFASAKDLKKALDDVRFDYSEPIKEKINEINNDPPKGSSNYQEKPGNKIPPEPEKSIVIIPPEQDKSIVIMPPEQDKSIVIMPPVHEVPPINQFEPPKNVSNDNLVTAKQSSWNNRPVDIEPIKDEPKPDKKDGLSGLTIALGIAAAMLLIVCAREFTQLSSNEAMINSYNTAISYYKGENGEPDYEAAYNNFVKSADAGNTHAQNAVGTLYYGGMGVEQDYTKALDWYLKSAENENADAMSNIGHIYYYGEGVEKDSAEALKWYERAADNGSAIAMYNLGVMYSRGTDVVQDYNKAQELLIAASDKGNLDAALELAQMYFYGQGVEKDYEKAFEYVSKCEETGNVEVYKMLGNMYKLGLGVTADASTAIKYYDKAADLGDAFSSYAIGNIYYNASGVKKNYAKAFDYFYKASQLGSTDADFALGCLYSQDDYQGRSPEQSYYYFLKAAEAGHTSAQYNLGVLYSNGDGIEKNDVKAFEWYEKAANSNHEGSIKALIKMYQTGTGVKADAEKAAMWQKKLDELAKEGN